MTVIAERYTEYMYNLIDRVIKDIGPRESCSREERDLGRLFADEIEPACDSVETESFTCSPAAFLGFFPYLVLMYFAGLALYFFLPPVSLALAFAGCAVLYIEVVRYKEFIDPLFPRKEGENVVGLVKPRGEVRRRVYVSAHFDSAYEFKIWLWFKSLSVPVMGIGILAVLLLFGFSLARTIAEPVGLPGAAAFRVLGYVLIALSPVVLVFAFFHTGDVAIQDEEGYLRIVDRTKDMIIVSGFKVFSKRVEEVLSEHPAIDMIALIGVPNPDRPGSELVKALITVRADYTYDGDADALKADILKMAKEKLTPYEVPKQIEIREEFPLTTVGKVDKKVLRKEAG